MTTSFKTVTYDQKPIVSPFRQSTNADALREYAHILIAIADRADGMCVEKGESASPVLFMVGDQPYICHPNGGTH